jgi:two-component system, response regulator
MRMIAGSTILVVEDSVPDGLLTIDELRRFGVANPIEIACSGLAALDLLFDDDHPCSTLPLVMLLDLRMPIVTGIDVLRRVRADLRTKPLPVIVLSSSESDVDAMQCFTLSADYRLPKPLSFWEWQLTMRRLGLEHAIQWRNEPARAKAQAGRAGNFVSSAVLRSASGD